MIINLNNLTIKKTQELIKNRSVSCRELVSAYLVQIKEKNSELNGYLEVFEESAYETAKIEDKNIALGDIPKPLSGIPLAIKDNILIKGKIASAASRILENYIASYDATVITKLKSAGAIFLGRTNMDEFAMGASTENSAFSLTKNPYDLERVAGGSSGGSGAVVAANMCLGAFGSDTGGSIRMPAALCGVVGLKPTYGAVSRYGLIALASSLDQIGPIAKTVEDAEILFNTIKGKDEHDSTTIEPEFLISNLEGEQIPYGIGFQFLKNLKIGVPEEFFSLKEGGKEGLSKEVADVFTDTLDKLKSLNYEIKQISLPSLPYSIACYYIIVTAEASSNLARFDGIRYGLRKNGENLLEDYLESREAGFGKEPKKRIMLGTYVLSSGYYDAYYLKAQKAREYIKNDFKNAFREVDLILTPTAPETAFKIGEKTKDPLSMYLADIFTVSVNLAGLPAVSIPKMGEKLPIGIQIISPWFREDLLFRLGKEIENKNFN